jgi:cytidylate kinase
MTLPLTIAIDGPAASGKTTLAEILAERLGYLFLDTGLMYRAVTLAALNTSCLEGKDQEEAVAKIAQEMELDITPPSIKDGRKCDVILSGLDVTHQLTLPQVEANVSQVSAYGRVRQALTARQREIGLRGKVVMVGRDIGTVVLPEADVKIFLDASIEERADRRHKELCKNAGEIAYETVLESLKQRDRIDSTRKIAPLMMAQDAVVINSDGCDIEQVVAKAMEIIRHHGKP